MNNYRDCCNQSFFMTNPDWVPLKTQIKEVCNCVEQPPINKDKLSDLELKVALVLSRLQERYRQAEENKNLKNPRQKVARYQLAANEIKLLETTIESLKESSNNQLVKSAISTLTALKDYNPQAENQQPPYKALQEEENLKRSIEASKKNDHQEKQTKSEQNIRLPSSTQDGTGATQQEPPSLLSWLGNAIWNTLSSVIPSPQESLSDLFAGSPEIWEPDESQRPPSTTRKTTRKTDTAPSAGPVRAVHTSSHTSNHTLDPLGFKALATSIKEADLSNEINFCADIIEHINELAASQPNQAGGLQNLGQTCFTNAVIQQIRHNPILRALILTENNIASPPGKLLFKTLNSIIEIQEAKRVVPEQLLELTGLLLYECDRELTFNNQHDASHVLQLLLDLAEGSPQMDLIKIKATKTRSISEDQLIFNPGLEIHGGKIELSATAIDSPYIDLQIPPGIQETTIQTLIRDEYSGSIPFNLTDYINGHFDNLPSSEEILKHVGMTEAQPDEGCFAQYYNGQYYKIANRVDATTRIENPPQCLVLTLGRLTHEGRANRRNPAKIDLPEILEFPQECLAEGAAPRRYKLVSCAIHGGSATGGHYTAYARDPYSATGKFQYLNDTRVDDIKNFKAQDIQTHIAKGWTNATYILMD